MNGEKLTKDYVKRLFATAFQDGYGCALRHKNYKNRTDEHTEALWQLISKNEVMLSEPKMVIEPIKHDNEDGICSACGANIKQYWYKLTPGLIDILIILLDFVHENQRNSFNQKDVRDKLEPYQYTQFTKLRFHGLIAKIKDEDGIWHGDWLITSRSAEFLRGDISIPQKVQTFRNRVIGHDDINITVREVYGSDIYLETKVDFIAPRKNNNTQQGFGI